MSEQELKALRILMANAACTLTLGCDLCPLYAEQVEKPETRGSCAEKIKPTALREALIELRGFKP